MRDKIYRVLAIEDERERETAIADIEQEHNDLMQERDMYRDEVDARARKLDELQDERDRYFNDLQVYKDRVRLLTGSGNIQDAKADQIAQADKPDLEDVFFDIRKEEDR